ncbi:MAG: ABC transporter ATP-binding protein [Chloroflexota bacterium]
MAVITLNDVSFVYNVSKKKLIGSEVVQRVHALDAVNLRVENEFLSIVGPSGCGKTTVLKLIAGLYPPSRGSISIGGQAVRGPSAAAAMVFQHIGLFPWRTIEANILLGYQLKYRRVDDRARQLLKKYVELVGLTGFEKHFPHQLSGGMQQRVGLCRALMVEPQVLLMDEPFGALDAQTRTILQDQLLRLQEYLKATIIFVTHDLEEAIYLSDRVVILSRRPGRIKEVIPVDLPSPRYAHDVKSDARYQLLRRDAWNCLKEEIQPPQAALAS